MQLENYPALGYKNICAMIWPFTASTGMIGVSEFFNVVADIIHLGQSPTYRILSFQNTIDN